VGRAVALIEQRDASVREGHARESPFGFRDLGRRRGERCGERHHFVAERHFVFQVAAVQRFDPHDGCGLIGTPLRAARSRWHAGQRHAFARRDVRDCFRHLAATRPDFDALRESAHRDEMRERFLDPRDDDVLTVWRRGHVAEDCRPADGGLRRGELTGEVVLKQRIVVRRLQEIFVRRSRRGLAVVFVDVRSQRHDRVDGRRTATGGDERADDRHVVAKPVARIVTPRRIVSRVGVVNRCVQTIGAGHDLGLTGRRVGDPELDAAVLRVGE